jgi:hypothetical protein
MTLISQALCWIRRLLLVANFAFLLAVLIAWPWSYFVRVAITYNLPSSHYCIIIPAGRICAIYFLGDTFGATRLEYKFSPTDRTSSSNTWSYMDFGTFRPENHDYRTWLGVTIYTPGDGDHGITIPSSFLCLLLSIWPVLSYRRWVKTRHLRQRGFPMELTPKT